MHERTGKLTFRKKGDCHLHSVPGGEVNILGGHSIGHSKQKSAYVHVSFPNSFRDTAISLYSANLLIRKRYYALFLISVFIVQVTKSVQFT
jgi:hypothetical protein